MKKFFVALAICLSTMQLASCYPNIENNPCITKDMKKKMEPYLLPIYHPAKPILDRLFANGRVTQNADTLAEAGFITVSVRPFSFCMVVKHPDLPGYLLKIYLDSESRIKLRKEGWEWLVLRCEGAAKVRDIIRQQNLKHFSVPDKWLYPLPAVAGKCAQPVVLLVTDMNLVSQEETDQVWKTKVTPELLRELYHVLRVGGASCHVGWNIPYTKKGQFSCIDTEHPDRRPNFKAVKQYLSEEMALEWDKIVKKNANKKEKFVKKKAKKN